MNGDQNQLSAQHMEAEGKAIKLDLFKKYCQVREGHPGSVLSIFDIVNVLYLSEAVRIEPGSEKNDVLIMSKGHAASVQYPFLMRKGLIPQSDWENWGTAESSLRVFGNNGIPGIDVTSGSLGHGVGIGSGMALSDALTENNPRRIFVIISEGELYEGSTWEALLFLAHHRLTNVKVILDVNRNMILGRPEDCVGLEPIAQKFEAFNFAVTRINGHDYQQIIDGIDFLLNSDRLVPVLIADTVKGRGVSFMEDKAESHYWGNLSEQQMAQMLRELSQ